MKSVPNRCTEVHDKLRRDLRVVAAGGLDKEDCQLIVDVLAMRCSLLYDLSSGSTFGTKVPDGFLRTIKGLKTLDVGEYTDDWKVLREVITSQDFLRDYPRVDACSQAFKQLVRGRIHYKWISTSALGLIEGDEWFGRLNQWVVFDSKVNLQSLDLTTASCLEYLDFEAHYPQMTLTPEDINVLRYEAKRAIGDFNLLDYPFRGHHGNGATKEVRRAHADFWHKNRYFLIDSSIKRYLKWRLNSHDWRSALYYPYKGLDRTSVVVCVPKSMTKNRTISKEPTTLQFLQQDIFEAMDDWFNDHPHLGIHLHDQTASRDLARRGSESGSYATIDLSSASDSVSVAHVELLFDGLPILYPLMATRSTHAEVISNDMSVHEVIRTRKFAPMGSATCFPVESLVFSIFVASAIRLRTGRRPERNDFLVYGDDIVVKDAFYKDVISLLERGGFCVNMEKSFGNDSSRNHFREACGVEALNGKDVTPLRLSRRLQTLQGKVSRHRAGIGVGQVDLLNRAYLYGYRYLRRFVNDKLVEHEWYKGCLRLSHADYEEFVESIEESRQSSIRVSNPFVLCDDGTDTQWRCFRSKYFGTLQCLGYSVSVIKTRSPKLHHDGNDFYSWCVSTVTRKAPDEISLDATRIVTIRSRDLKWSKQWVLKS